MAGHSHSANIAIRKGKQDRIRANVFAKLSKNIMVAARRGPDPDSNFGLRHAIELARAQSMPKDKIDHAIKKGAGLLEGVKLTEIIYEGYGHGGVAFVVEALSDNLNRTRPEVARIFESSGGKLAAANAVLWMFKRRGVIAVKTSLIPEEKLMELVLDAGADDVNTFGDLYEILTGIESFEPVRKALAAKNIAVESAEMRFLPDNPVEVELAAAKKILALAEKLDEHDDVSAVHHSMKITDELVAALKASPD